MSAPARLCCGKRHFGPECHDGTFMCVVCFRKVPTSAAWTDLHGAKWDACQECGPRIRTGDESLTGGSTPETIKAATHSDQTSEPCCEDGPSGHTQQQHHDASACFDLACTFDHPHGGPFPHPCDQQVKI